jgi:hypothetical protein
MAGELRNMYRSEVGTGDWCFGFVVNGLWFERRYMGVQTVVVSNGLKRDV